MLDLWHREAERGFAKFQKSHLVLAVVKLGVDGQSIQGISGLGIPNVWAGGEREGNCDRLVQ
jgi:hypothetical protein